MSVRPRLVALAALALCVPAARAEPATTRVEVVLRAKPGDNQDPVATYAAGAAVTILETQGRWLRVKIGDSVGWMPRTKLVAEAAPAAAAPPARALTVTLSTAAPLRQAPDDTAAVIATVAAGATVEVVDGGRPRWLEVRGEAGRGWLATAALTGAVTAPPPPIDRPPPRRALPRPRRLELDGGLALGYRSLRQSFASDATGGLADYQLDADAAALTGRARAIARPRGALVVELELRGALAYSDPGVAYPGPTLPPGDVPFSLVSGELAVRAGLTRGPATLTVGGAALYQAFLPAEVANAALIARERLLGAAVDARLELAAPRTAARVGLGGQWLAAGDRAQTPGLRDGATATPRQLALTVDVRYPVGRHLDLSAGLLYQRAATAWTGMSERWADVTAAERVDRWVGVELGLGARR